MYMGCGDVIISVILLHYGAILWVYKLLSLREVLYK